MTHSPSWGTVLSWDIAGGTSYTAVGQVKDITGPGITRGDIDVSDHDSANNYREFLPGLADGGNVTFSLGFDPANAQHIQTAGTGLMVSVEQDGCIIPSWTIVNDTCAGTATLTFDAYVNGYTFNFPVEGEITGDLSLKVTGRPVLGIT